MSNRQRSARERAHAHAAAHPGDPRRPRTSARRAGVNRRSHAALARLHAMPRWAVPVVTVLLVFVGLWAGPVVGGLCLLAVAVFLGWLAYLAWPQLGTGARAVRTIVLGALAALAVARLLAAWG